MATIDLDTDALVMIARELENAAERWNVSGVQTRTAETLLTAAYQIQEQIKPPPLANSPAVARFQVTAEDLESLAGGTVPEWLKYDADAALGQTSTEPATSEDLTPEQSRIWEEGFDEACKEIIRDLQRIHAKAITAPEHCVLNKGIAAAKRQMARP